MLRAVTPAAATTSPAMVVARRCIGTVALLALFLLAIPVMVVIAAHSLSVLMPRIFPELLRRLVTAVDAMGFAIVRR